MADSWKTPSIKNESQLSGEHRPFFFVTARFCLLVLFSRSFERSIRIQMILFAWYQCRIVQQEMLHRKTLYIALKER